MKAKNKAIVSEQCVACGHCVKVCPLGALSIPQGIRAVVDELICVGCGKCVSECPAAVITITQKEAARV